MIVNKIVYIYIIVNSLYIISVIFIVIVIVNQQKLYFCSESYVIVIVLYLMIDLDILAQNR